jgi:Mrp family chromosome partitioning ATPase
LDSIKQALDIVKSTGSQGAASDTREGVTDGKFRSFQLNPEYLESTRIVAHGTGAQGRYYDMLRTQVLQEMDDHGWQFIAVTSATAGCGKTVTSCNLALSIARLTERSVLLVDMDMQKPKAAEYLGIKERGGLLSVLQNNGGLADALVEANLGTSKLLVLPGEVCRSGSSEWMASQSMASLLQILKREFRSRVVIFDMPPLLLGDDVISVLPQMDAVMLIAGVGQTSTGEIKQCQKHLKNTPLVRVVVNRVTEPGDAFYGYY